MNRDLTGAVVVITGASAGIGRAAALRFADEGARLVLTARQPAALESLAHECEARGCAAIAVPADVTDEGQVQDVARRAVERFGPIDVWVNNAAVAAFGRFEETPADIFQRVFDVNFFGYVNGARVALPHFREQGYGTLINVSSVVGTIGQPYTTAYTSSKWAIRGLTQSLQGELSLDEARDINVCSVLPAAIDTPLFHTAANYTGRAARPLDPIYSADMVANTIVSVARHPRRETYAGMAGRLATLAHILLPGPAIRIFARQVEYNHFEPRVQPPTRGNLFEPFDDAHRVSGGWLGSADAARAGAWPAGLAPLAMAAAGIATALWAARRWRRHRRRRLETPQRIRRLLPAAK